jgi:hypothetical protein
MDKPTISQAALAARRNGTTIERELIANGWVDPERYYCSLARVLRLPFLHAIHAALVNDDRKLDTQLIDARTETLHGGEFVVIYDTGSTSSGSATRGPGKIRLERARGLHSSTMESWISAAFAICRAVAHAAADAGETPAAIALGGTSNHSVSPSSKPAAAGIPYNVTEDADLGMRVYRLRYRCANFSRGQMAGTKAVPGMH